MRRWQVFFILTFSCFLQASSHAASPEDIAVEFASRAGKNMSYAIRCRLDAKDIQNYEKAVIQLENDRWKGMGIILNKMMFAYNSELPTNSSASRPLDANFCRDINIEIAKGPSVILDAIEHEQLIIERERFIRIYRETLASAKTSSQFDAFVYRYSNDDPENLVPRAIVRRDELRLIEEKQRQYEQDQKRQRMGKVESFRRAIKVETETNCGPVLEIKGALVKIYSPVANYGNEHWIRKEQVFPPIYGCRFINGNYEPPSL